MTQVKLIVDKKTIAFCSTSEIMPAEDEVVFREDGAIAYGDGVTQIKNLTFVGGGVAVSSVNGQTGVVSLDASDVGADPTGSAAAAESNANDYTDTVAATKQDRVSALLTGGVITVETIDGTGTLNDIRVTASGFYIEGSGDHSAIETTFLNFSLAPSGQFYYIGIYGTTSDTVIKVDGTAGVAAVPPTTPANSVLFKYVIVNDSGASVAPDLSGYLLTSDYKGLCLAYHWTTFSPLDGVLYYIGTAGLAMSTTASTPHAIAPITGVIYAASITTRNNTVNTTEPSTFSVDVNGLVSTITTHIFNSTPPCQKFVSGLNIPIVQGDYIYLRMLAASWVTNPTNTAGTVVLYIR